MQLSNQIMVIVAIGKPKNMFLLVRIPFSACYEFEPCIIENFLHKGSRIDFAHAPLPWLVDCTYWLVIPSSVCTFLRLSPRQPAPEPQLMSSAHTLLSSINICPLPPPNTKTPSSSWDTTAYSLICYCYDTSGVSRCDSWVFASDIIK